MLYLISLGFGSLHIPLCKSLWTTSDLLTERTVQCSSLIWYIYAIDTSNLGSHLKTSAVAQLPPVCSSCPSTSQLVPSTLSASAVPSFSRERLAQGRCWQVSWPLEREETPASLVLQGPAVCVIKIMWKKLMWAPATKVMCRSTIKLSDYHFAPRPTHIL